MTPHRFHTFSSNTKLTIFYEAETLKYPCSSKHFRCFCPRKLGQKYTLSSILPAKSTIQSGWCFLLVWVFGGRIRKAALGDSPVDCRALPAGRQCNHRSASGTRRRSLVTRSIKSPAKTVGLFFAQMNDSLCNSADFLLQATFVPAICTYPGADCKSFPAQFHIAFSIV